MHSLNFYKSRKHSEVTLSDKQVYKIPNEYTVEEVERLLELRTAQEALEKETVQSEETQLEKFWSVVFEQIEIIFQHHQPDIKISYLKKVITHNEALDILGFFQKYRQAAITQLKEQQPSDTEESKKKVKPAKTELRDLRRVIAFMVVNGFSLIDLRKLYIDELYKYYDETIFTLERLGKVKEGSYAKIKVSDDDSSVQSTVDNLRTQMLNSIVKK